MSIFDATTDSIEAAYRAADEKPLAPEKPKSKGSIWSAVPKAIGAAGLEASANLGDISYAAQRRGQTPIFASGDPLRDIQDTAAFTEQVGPIAADRSEETFRNPVSDAIYSEARNLRPDPMTAGKAEQIVFGLTKGLTKAVGGAVLAGPVGGAVGFGASEGMTTAEDLAAEGVDQATRVKVGAVTAGINAAGMILPVAGQTLKQTAALVAVGGPGSFVAQQVATRKILENADYKELAEQYDPLDPTGLAIATLLPAGFAGVVKYRQYSAGRVKAPQDHIDAAMTQNLTISRDAYESRPTDQPVVYPENVPRASSLPVVERQIEARLADKVVNDYRGSVDEYSRLPEAEGGKVLNVDTARELSPDYAANRDTRSMLSSAVHEPASHFIKQLYAERLAEMPPGSKVMFTAGGTGAGKSTAIDSIPSIRSLKDESYLVYDTNMNGLESSIKKIEQALEAGAKVEIVHIQRDPIDALVSGALPRAARSGRTVPLSAHEATHAGSAKTIAELAQKYADDPRVSIRVLDNTKGRGEAKEATVEFVKGFNYNKLRERLVSALEKEYQNGRISEAIYRGTLDAALPARGLVRSATDPRVPEGLSGSQRGGNPNPDSSGREAGLSSTEPGASQGTDGSSVSSQQNPVIRSVLDRVESIKSEKPDLPVAMREDGTRATAADELEAIRREAREGTDTELGADDAPLLQVAAECFLSKGG